MIDRSDAEEFLNGKDIWNHPRIATRNNNDFEVADLMAEFAIVKIKEFIKQVEAKAEEKMLKTGKLEGAHYAAMKELSVDL